MEPGAISLEESAKAAGVSIATIRNWIKTGYLVSAGKGQVTTASLAQFWANSAGSEKLTKRANKSLKDEHDHLAVTKIFLERASQDDFDPVALGSEYECNLSDSYRNKEGIYYTPKSVVRDLFCGTALDVNNATFCDPCCGSGNFVSQALALGFRPENIYAYDTDPVAVEITKKRILSESGYQSANVRTADFLTLAASPDHPFYDCIYTNPPWGKKLGKENKNFMGGLLGAGDSVDTCSLFFFACLRCLGNGAELGLLLPEAFFNISAYESARIRALEQSVIRLVDYGKPFAGLLTKAQALVLKKSTENLDCQIVCTGPKGATARSKKSFSENPKSILNLYCSKEDADVISYIFSLPHITLENQASWGLGIVTGNNGKLVETSFREGLMPVFRGADISKKTLREPSAFIPGDLSLYQQVAPLELYQAGEKLIYKFISSELCFYHDTQQRFILNSANMLIPDSSFPLSASLLCDLLNSDFINWLFTRIFNTHKILRGDLESLPLHSQFLTNEIFDETKYLAALRMEKQKNGAYRIKK